MSPRFLIKLAILFAALLPGQAFTVWGQFPLFSSAAGKDQLNGGNATRVLQDSKGFIWLGTTRGLFVYDGFDFREAPFPDSLKGNEVTALALDKKGMVWAGFTNGQIARGHEDGFSVFEPAEGLPTVKITDLLFDTDSTLWISTYGEGIYYYKRSRLYNINTDDGLGDNYVYTLARNSDGDIWAGNDAGISVLNLKGKHPVIRQYSTRDGLPDIIVQRIVTATSGGLWIGMQEKGICYYNAASQSFEYPLSSAWDEGPVNDILDFGDLLWIATEGNGLVELSLKKTGFPALFTRVENTGKRLSRLIQDREGSIWLVSSGSLLWSSGPGIRHYKNAGELRLGNIHAIHAGKNGRFWFGNDSGLFLCDPEKGAAGFLKLPLPYQSKDGPGITSIYNDPKGNIWIGTFGNGLYRLPGGTQKPERISDSSGALNNNILGISGKGEDIWFATLGGAARCRINPAETGAFVFDHFTSGDGIANNFIYTVLADRKDRIWFGTDGKGAAMYANGRFTGFGPKQGLPARVIYSVTEDSDGHLWFSSVDKGVYRYDGSGFANFSLGSGLRDLSITAIASGAQNQVVVVHNQGVDVINSRTGQVSYLGMRSGISDINPDLNAVSSDAQGTVWIGTRDGIIHYTPGYLNAMAMPATAVRRASVYLSDVPARDGEKFPHNRNHLSFEYIGLWFNSPEKVTYRVKLEGNDPDWIPTGDRVTTYSNLRPGKYTFRVQSSLNNNFTYASEATFSFTISAPFYSRWWFILGVALLISGSAYWLFKTRLNRMQREQQLLKEKAESQFQMLKSQVNPHFLFNNFSTLMAIIEEDKDLAIEYVGKLSAFFRYILEYRDKDLIPLSEELEIAENYLFLQQKRYGDNLSVTRDIKPEHLESLIPPLTLQLLLENAVKHNIVSAAKPLNISIYSAADCLVIENRPQPRKTPEPSTGMGLQNIRSRYRIFTNRDIVIDQSAEFFRISLPLIFFQTKQP